MGIHKIDFQPERISEISLPRIKMWLESQFLDNKARFAINFPAPLAIVPD